MDGVDCVFKDVPRDPRGHLGLLFYAAVYHLIYFLRCRAADSAGTLDQVFGEHPFLNQYFDQIRDRFPRDLEWGQSFEWLRAQIEMWENAAGSPLPLLEMRRALRLPYGAALLFVLCGSVEEDAQFSDLFALLDPRGQRRMSASLALHIFEGSGAEDAWRFVRALLDAGFLHVANRDAPRSEWILRVPSILWTAVRGECAETPLAGVRLHSRESLSAISDLIVDPAVRDQLTELHRLVAAGRTETIIVRGMAGTDRIGAAGAIARELDYCLLAIDCTTPSDPDRWRLIGPLCTLSRALPVFIADTGPGETFEIPSPEGRNGPCAVVLGREGGVGGTAAAHAVTIHLELESPAIRSELWTRALNGKAPADLSAIAASFCLPGSYIAQCAHLAIDYAAIGRRTSVSLEDVQQAARVMNRQVLDTLAARIDGPARWSHLVVRDATLGELRVMEERCRHRERLATAFDASIPGGMNRGVRALFEGPSGTGKTLAARVLANQLGLDLYRVDLAAIVNKYIGETEKNLSRVLGRAEDLGVILLLDEGDSLMTRRTEVKSSNDRYANLETNYLLQRLETYTGIVIVTTNAGQSIDSAFRRRMDAVVKFDLPDAGERFQLWQAHLPADHQVSMTTLEEIALRYPLSGGQIRNVSIRAGLLSLARKAGPVDAADLREALQAEHRKAGASFVEGSAEPAARNERSIAAFLGGLS